MGITYGYFIGGLLLAAVWLIIFLLRKDLRQEMWFSSLLILPFGFTEFFYIPEFWNPPSLFNLIPKFGFGIESFLFSFTVGGIASVAYEFLFKTKLVTFVSRGTKSKHWLIYIPYLLFFGLSVGLEFLYPLQSMRNLFISFVLGTVVLCVLRVDLIHEALWSGFIFATLYFLLFKSFTLLFPQFISSVYTFHTSAKILIFGIPLQEILFGFSTGAAWSSLYEIMRNKKFSKIKSIAQ
jgi:hypothetical protein